MARISGINRNILLVGDKLTAIFPHDGSIGQTRKKLEKKIINSAINKYQTDYLENRDYAPF